MAENNNFRNAVRGYNKEDVNRFILESDRLRRDAEAELQEKIQLISEERDALRNEATAATDALALANQNLDDKIGNLLKAEEQIAALQNKLADSESVAARNQAESEKTIKELENMALESENELSAVKTELKKVSDSLTHHIAEKDKLTNELNALRTENKRISDEYNAQATARSTQANAYDSLEKNYRDLQSQNDLLTEKNNELANEMLALKNELTQIREKQKEESEASDYGALLIEFESLKAELTKAQMENDTLRAQAAVPAAGASDDALQTRLGEVILQANRTAEQIIREATNTAKLIKMGAVEEATVIKKNFEEKMQERAERAERLLSELSEKYFAAFECTKNELGSQVSALIAEKQAELSEKAAALQKETEEGLLLTDAQAAALLN